MKKIYLLIVLAALQLATVSCLKPLKVQEDENSIVVWDTEDSTVTPFVDSTFEKFKKLSGNEKVKITRVHYENEDLRNQFQAASIANTAPDLLMCSSDIGGAFAVAGFIMPVDDAFQLSNYNDAVLAAIELDGKHWGVPISNGNHLMLMYNKKFVSNPPSTTEELFKFCDTKVKSQNLSYCLAFDSVQPFWFMPWLGSFGGWPLDNRTPTLNTKPMLDAVKFYMDLRHTWKYIPQECDYNCMDMLFKESKVPFIINGDWAISKYVEVLKDSYAVAKIPFNSKTGRWPTPMISGKYFMLSSKLAKNKKLELIKKFVTFYTNEQNQIEQVKILKRLPSLKSANNSSVITNDVMLNASISQILVGKPMPMATEMQSVWDSSRQYLSSIMSKKITPEDGLKRLQADVESKIQGMDR